VVRAFEDDKDVIMAINEWIEEQDQNVFCQGMNALHQLEKCVDLRRNCVQKWQLISCVCFFITH